MLRGRGGTGRHTGLKILRGRPRAGSTPAVRTSFLSRLGTSFGGGRGTRSELLEPLTASPQASPTGGMGSPALGQIAPISETSYKQILSPKSGSLRSNS